MDKDLKKTLNEALVAILDRVQSTEKFVLDQAPVVCKEILTEVAISICLILFLGSALFSLGAYLVYHHFSSGEVDSTFLAIGFAFLFLSFFNFIVALIDILTLKLCPKLTLLRKIKALINPRSN